MSTPGREAPHPTLHSAQGHPLPARGERDNDGQFTCPMHPEVIRDGPGFCPICGMALEPRTAALDDAPNPELIDMRRRLIVCAILTFPILFNPAPLIQLALVTPIVLWGALPFYIRGIRSLNMFTLIVMGVSAAYLFSVASLFIHGPLYFDPAAVIVTLVLLGQVIELRARERTSSAIKSLLQLAPKTARVVMSDGSEHDFDVAQIVPGMRIRVRPGERVPVDGVIEGGSGALDES